LIWVNFGEFIPKIDPGFCRIPEADSVVEVIPIICGVTASPPHSARRISGAEVFRQAVKLLINIRLQQVKHAAADNSLGSFQSFIKQ